MVFIGRLDEIDCFLNEIEDVKLIAIDDTLGFYFRHAIVRNKKRDKNGEYPYNKRMVLAINHSDNHNKIPEHEEFFVITEGRLLTLLYPTFQKFDIGKPIKQKGEFFPPNCGVYLGKGEYTISTSESEIIKQMKQFGYHDSYPITRLKRHIEPMLNQKNGYIDRMTIPFPAVNDL